MIADARGPRIVGVSKNQTSLLDYREAGEYVPYRKEQRHREMYNQARMLLTDNEIKLLVLWAIIAPFAALAYLIWIKYEDGGILAVFLFAISIVQFVFQWQGMYTLASRFLNPWGNGGVMAWKSKIRVLDFWNWKWNPNKEFSTINETELKKRFKVKANN